MEMDVMIQSPAADFNFDSACTSPYMSAPGSPQRGGCFFSAPTTPARVLALRSEFNYFAGDGQSLSAIPFKWEEKPGVPKSKDFTDDDGADFEFDFSGQLERTSLSADELFDGGKIKPLTPPPRLQIVEHVSADSPKSPKSPRSAKILKEALSPRSKRIDFDPFAAAIEQTRRESNKADDQQRIKQTEHQQRGRERKHTSSATSARHKGSRSLSPLRVCDIFENKGDVPQSSNLSMADEQSSSSSSAFSSWNWRGYKKWKLKDLLLFRSASEGRATGKDSLKKYALLKRSTEEDAKNLSFRSKDSVGSPRGGGGRRGAPVSAHELLYTANRAASEEMKKKTFLPYKQGLLGCLGFNPAVNHQISRAIGSMTRGS